MHMQQKEFHFRIAINNVVVLDVEIDSRFRPRMDNLIHQYVYVTVKYI